MFINLLKKNAKCVLLFSILYCFLLFIYLINAEAVEPTEGFKAIQLDPAKIRLVISPNNAHSGKINIYNPSGEPRRVKVYLEDWKYLPVCDGTKDFKPAGTTDLSVANWISFVPDEFTIPAFGKQVLNYTVRVPADAKGGHYAVLFFESYVGDQTQTKEGVSVNLAVRIASLFYIEPKGTIERQAKIENVKVAKKQNKNYLTAKFSNIGNVDINAKGTFFIIDKKGMVYARGEFNEVFTFPQDSATFTSYWKESIPNGTYDLILTIDISKPLREARLEEAPSITKEFKIEIGENGEVAKISEF